VREYSENLNKLENPEEMDKIQDAFALPMEPRGYKPFIKICNKQ
jgi:hypothetical protein